MTVIYRNMNILTEKIFEIAPFGYITNQDIATLFPKSQAARDSLIKRAIASGQIIRICRGLYCLSLKYQKKNLNLYALAQHIYGPSYISLESALSRCGWIPEAVYTLTSVSSNRSNEFKTQLGTFSYSHIPQKTFYTGVERLIDDDGDVFFMAWPIKALADYVYVNRKDWSGLKPAVESLRIEPEEFESVRPDDIDTLIDNYKSRRVLKFLKGVRRELKP